MVSEANNSSIMKNFQQIHLISLGEEELVNIYGGHKGGSYGLGYIIGALIGLFL